MGTIKEVYDRVKSLNVKEVIHDAIDENLDVMLESNKEQMLEGKNNLGTDLTPSYFDDPYFKSREAAQRYSDWKDKITPNAKRKKGTPNYFINGMFHDSLTISRKNDQIVFNSNFSGADDIFSKAENLMGLGGTIKSEFIKERLRPSLRSKIRKKINL